MAAIGRNRILVCIRANNVADYLYRVVPKSYKWVGFTAKCPIRPYADNANVVRGFIRSFLAGERIRYCAYSMENGPIIGWHIHGIVCVSGSVPKGTVDKCFLRVFYHRQFSRNLRAVSNPLSDARTHLTTLSKRLPTALGWLRYMVKIGPAYFNTIKPTRPRKKAEKPPDVGLISMESDQDSPIEDAPCRDPLSSIDWSSG